MGKLVLQLFLLAGALFVAWRIGVLVLRFKFPPAIPSDLAFRHELETTLQLREVAEALAKRFPWPRADSVVCLGPVRGNAARLLFHAGPDNTGKNVNIHRPDYLLHVKRLGKHRVALELGLNRPYSYVRLSRSEMEPLVRALRQAYGELTRL